VARRVSFQDRDEALAVCARIKAKHPDILDRLPDGLYRYMLASPEESTRISRSGASRPGSLIRSGWASATGAAWPAASASPSTTHRGRSSPIAGRWVGPQEGLPPSARAEREGRLTERIRFYARPGPWRRSAPKAHTAGQKARPTRASRAFDRSGFGCALIHSDSA
jgi:hypothetical protein